MQSCPFCTLDAKRILRQTHHAIVIRDGFPVSRGHTLIIPKRHVNSFFELTDDERVDIFSSLNAAKEYLDYELRPDGYNIGINDGAAAGQTVPHLHIHLIPRYKGDRPDPRGGVRWVIPKNADYWSDREDAVS
ncbi:HIT family protein [Sedimenticola selenatireducens]|uniref:HIT family protein n=1 Tax=Sedimenticola selenatireducens TaxID=191960 RepID=UPI00056B779B|nr:HIT family protein [Sedimenticola selenatireducens]